ncbi:Autophagy-related protein 13 [Dirofilaria immitis]|nr:Autophagy-related protein 13 [Dirofilaria immitis]
MSDSATCSKSYQEFVKFGKFFTTRLVQALVQSRLGQLIVQSCSVSPDPTDWFSVRIDELGEVAAQLRTSVTKYPPNANCFTLDFLLHTADGDVLPLESWHVSFFYLFSSNLPPYREGKCIRYESELTDGNVNIRTELYHQLGTLLKSAIVASRMTPAYRYYVRKQSPDTFIIMYRVYEKEPEMDLGEEQKNFLPSLVNWDLVVAAALSHVNCGPHSLTFDEFREMNVTTVAVLENVDINEHQSDMNIDVPMLIPFGPVPVRGGEIEPITPVSNLTGIFNNNLAKQNELVSEAFSRRVHFHLGHSRSSSDDACHRGDVCSNENIFGLDRNSSQPYSSSLPHRLASMKNRSRTHSFPFSTLLTTATNDLIPGQGFLGGLEESDKITPTSSLVVVLFLFIAFGLKNGITTQCGRNVENQLHSPSPSATLVASNSTCSATSVPNRMHQCATVPSGVNLMNNGANEKQEEDSAEETEVQSDDDDDDLTSSDGSYVKVAFGSSESLANGLGEFMKQCRSAPTHLSFQIDSTSVIPELLILKTKPFSASRVTITRNKSCCLRKCHFTGEFCSHDDTFAVYQLCVFSWHSLKATKNFRQFLEEIKRKADSDED